MEREIAANIDSDFAFRNSKSLTLSNNLEKDNQKSNAIAANHHMEETFSTSRRTKSEKNEALISIHRKDASAVRGPHHSRIQSTNSEQK